MLVLCMQEGGGAGSVQTEVILSCYAELQVGYLWLELQRCSPHEQQQLLYCNAVHLFTCALLPTSAISTPCTVSSCDISVDLTL